VTLNTVPIRVIGHPKPEGLTVASSNPNLVEGRELFGPSGLAIDTSASPPILYVSDTGNNRVLAWKSATGFSNSAFADLVIGQPDAYTTTSGGPGSTFSAGLSAPTGLAVRNGDLYVADSGNNRVLRFPKPFANIGQQVPNLIIGQPALATRVANYPDGKPTATGISLYPATTSLYAANLAFDGAGNLWLTDPGNRRVLRYPRAAIEANPANFPAADLVLGQQTPATFTDLLPNLTDNNAGEYNTTQFYIPEGITFDGAGRLYVTDANASASFPIGRVLIFDLANPSAATRIIGLLPQGTTNPPADIQNKTFLLEPSAVFFLPSNQGIGVLDKGSNRLLLYPPLEQWTDAKVAPPAVQVFGQNGDFSNRKPNNAPLQTYVPAPTASTLDNPAAGVMLNSALYVADSSNNRVIVLPVQGPSFGAASMVLGQLRLDTGSANLIEGKEFQFAGEAGMAIDSSGTTPHLYVSDPGNHRVLGFRDWRNLNANSKADIVIGQPDFQTALCNYPTGDPSRPTQSSLCFPVGLLVDSSGNLYVADSLNGRVLRFPAPFNYQGQPGTMEPADLVLGQKDFVTVFADPSQFNMARPYGLAFSGTTGLLVSDIADNRVLYFRTTNGTFTSANNGKAADKVFGQQDPFFRGKAAGSDAAGLNQPRHIACDTDGRLYVADTGNNRVQIFPDPNSQSTPIAGTLALLSITDNLIAPHGIYVSPLTGEIWITDTNNTRAKRYSSYALTPTNVAVTAVIPAADATLAVAQDQFGDLFLADNTNRVALYFPGLQALNGASFIPSRVLAPGMVASICAPGSNCVNGAAAFGTGTAAAQSVSPLPQTLADTQVLFNGQPTPLYFVSPTQINFVVPMGKQPGDVPTSGTADLQVVHVSTGQVLAAGSVQMNVASPGIFQLDFTGLLRRAAVLNEDGTVNSPTNPAARGSVIQIYGTGQGFTPGAPDDGNAAQSPVPTPGTPVVIINICKVDDSACTHEPPGNVKYSGLSAFPGGWQINVRIPQNTPINPQTYLYVGMNDIYSSDTASGFRMVIAVK
jgi:uncharacterized protein (TIGR03437 family)